MEWTGTAYHVRRRLSEGEQAMTGDACDLRGTDEGRKRLAKLRSSLPRRAIQMANEELSQD